ncbi:T9SS type A sorting domain-containing protein [Maribellus comscasis]|uniref:T9SS type A sorting domain-containing protein n=1 Tax=Maribellus comscasis TaxID=2681766 RepID=A0A6I6JVK5_9BACT|nr:T9SS type A sorting domain-containing protein [Maribellus comscasis]QGY47185.1 T9SS type A sorting domain-containing protein [Maribellus comscasis]
MYRIKDYAKDIKSIRTIAFIISFLLSSSVLCHASDLTTSSSSKYYVAVEGDDNNPGTLDQPFASWQKGIDVAEPGDTIFIRGGTYYADPEINDRLGAHIDKKNGTKDSMICLFAYPGETPLLDASTLTNTTRQNLALYIDESDYWHIKGLQVRGVSQQGRTGWIAGILIQNGSNNVIEHCTAFENEGIGIQIREDSEDNLLLNCDAYLNYDPSSNINGGNADGFQVCYIPYRQGAPRENILRGCRSWKNSDDGYDLWGNEGRVIFDRCWAFRNGTHRGDGYGFKMGKTSEPREEGIYRRILTHCIGAENLTWNFNNSESDALVKIYNCTAYRSKNFSGFDLTQDGHIMSGEIKNSISYHNLASDKLGNEILDEYNDWNLPEVTVTDDDFVSLDVNLLNAERKADGSLPEINYLKPKAGSDLVDAGMDVGLEYYGTAPDLGAIESDFATGAIDLDLNKDKIKVFPNPSDSKRINVDLGNMESSQTAAIDIYDCNGKTVYQKKNIDASYGNQRFISLDLSGLDSGIYILRYRNEFISQSCKLVMTN